MSGLSVAEFISIRTTVAAVSNAARHAPRTCGMHRSVYGSWTLCGPRCDGMISLRRRRRRMFAATSRTPACGFKTTSRSSYGFGEPRSASNAMDAATCASLSNRKPSCTASAPTPAMTEVPLMMARPSFDSRTSGATPARRNASFPVNVRPRYSARPSPTRTSPRWASGARSPLAPRDPLPPAGDGGDIVQVQRASVEGNHARTTAAFRYRDIVLARGPKALNPRGRSGRVHANRVPRHFRFVAHAEAECERGRDQAGSRGHPLRLRGRHATSVHAEQVELHAGLPRLRVPLPRRPFPRVARDGPEHVDERAGDTARGVRAPRDRATRG